MKILHVISSPRGAASNSIKLGNAIIDELKEKHPSAFVVVKNLASNPFPHLEESHLKAFFTPLEAQTPNDKEAIMHSNKAIAEIMDADVIVVGAPMYNFGICSTLKSWIDHIARAGITFKYSENGPIGLVTGKKVYLAIVTGGIYHAEDGKHDDFLTPYLKYVLAFLGMTDISVVRGEGFAVPSLKDTALDTAIDSIRI